jgi:hypothetical protein
MTVCKQERPPSLPAISTHNAPIGCRKGRFLEQERGRTIALLDSITGEPRMDRDGENVRGSIDQLNVEPYAAAITAS